jgi:hypothetical protein
MMSFINNSGLSYIIIAMFSYSSILIGLLEQRLVGSFVL